MKYLLPLIIIVPLLIPIFVSAQSYSETGFRGENRYCDDTAQMCCVDYEENVPCTGSDPADSKCFPYYCAREACSELWNQGQYCTLKVCCAVTRIRRFLFFIASGLAIIVVTWAGIMYMMAGGEERATKAKKILLYGLLGAAIVMGSSFMMNLLMEILY